MRGRRGSSSSTTTFLFSLLWMFIGTLSAMYVLFTYGLNPMLSPEQQMMGIMAAIGILAISMGGTITCIWRGTKVIVGGRRPRGF